MLNLCQISSLMAVTEGLVAKFSSFANFEERKRKSNLFMSFPKIVHQKGCFGKNKKKSVISLLPILDIFGLTLLTCNAMGSFPAIFAKFINFISGRAFFDLEVSYNVLDRSANFRNPGPSLLDMFGPSTKAWTHVFATYVWLSETLLPSVAHQAVLQIPLQRFWVDNQEIATEVAFSEFLKCSGNNQFQRPWVCLHT